MENRLLTDKHVLICLEQTELASPTELEYVKSNFCGIVLADVGGLNSYAEDTIVYLCGNIRRLYETPIILNKVMYVIKELSNNYCGEKLISIGEVPINVHNVGIYFRDFFSSDRDYFNLINDAHQFQSLTESNKPGTSYRKGIYMSNVQTNADDTCRSFNLLRCSTNFNGPTENFREIDSEIIDKVNSVTKHFFKEEVKVNHVLAQIYENHIIDGGKERKARIKDHSDKTKDMPRNALIVFCTFYKNLAGAKKSGFDYHYNDQSVLTKLRFRLKTAHTVVNAKKEFDVVLYPNSVFIISLETNRLYTHEIVPSILPISKIPIRMGYVIRCSKTHAVSRDGETYIVEDDKHIKLEKMTEDNVNELRKLYFEENLSNNMVTYGPTYFSMNDGDYQMPII
jgi:hypothetical protein